MAHYIAAQAQGGGGLDIYLDDGRRPIGSVRQALDGRGIGEIRSPDGYVVDFPPWSGGVRSERHAAVRMVIRSMLARASAGVR